MSVFVPDIGDKNNYGIGVWAIIPIINSLQTQQKQLKKSHDLPSLKRRIKTRKGVYDTIRSFSDTKKTIIIQWYYYWTRKKQLKNSHDLSSLKRRIKTRKGVYETIASLSDTKKTIMG